MPRRLLLYLFAVGVFLLPASSLHARERVQGWCEQGGNTLAVIGAIVTTDKAQESFPSCTITVWATGTMTLSTIFSDDVGTAKANPFTADSNGLWFFYADNARYDIQFSGGGIASPFTLADWLVTDTAQAVTTISAVTFSSTPVFDVGKASILTITLTGNVTSSTITNAVTGQVITIYIAQDATGGRTFVFPTNVQLRGGGYVVADDASAVSTITLYFDGTNWREIARDADEVGRDLVPVSDSVQALGKDTSRFKDAFVDTRISTVVIVPFSATPAFDASTGGVFTLTLTGNVTSSTITNPVGTGQLMRIYIAQDATGGRTFVFPTNVQLRGGIYTIASAASAVSTIEIYFDGTNWRELGRLSDEQFHNNLAARTLNDTYYNVKEYGAAGDGVADDTTAIQAAIDAADAAIVSTRAAPIVKFPPGDYGITATLDSKSVHLVGDMTNQGVRIVWNGAVGGTMITRTTQTSHFLLEGINFFGGTSNEPAVGLTFSGTVDHFVLLNRLQFSSISGDAIQLTNGWTNFRVYDTRWDDIGGFAIDATVHATQNLSSFVIDRFTYDHRRTSGPADGFLRFDNSISNVANAGTAVINGGRIEVNTAWTGNQAIVTLLLNNSPLGSRFLGLSITNATYQDVVGMASDVVLFRDTTDTTGAESLTLKNFRAEGLSATLGGTSVAGTFIPLPNSGIYSDVVFNNPGIERSHLVDAFHADFRTRVTGETAITLAVGTDTGERLQIRGDGRLCWGDGTAACDTIWRRHSANTLKTDDGFVHRDRFAMDNTGTPSVAGANYFTTGGTTAITFFDDGVNGQVIYITSSHSVVITDGVLLILAGSVNYSMTPGDALTLVFAGAGWIELARSVN